MKKMILVLLLLCMQAQSSGLEKNIQDLIKKNQLRNDDLGIHIYSYSENKIIWQLNANEPKIPASISKLATAAAVLDAFPLGTKFKTTLLSAAKVEDATLKGDLYLKGGGDPAFVSENMWYLVNVFKRNNIHLIKGSIVVDDQIFDSERYDKSRQSQRVDRAYDAPVGAMSFNWNSINIFVRPAQIGQTVIAFADPENNYIQLINKAKTVSGIKNSLVIERQETKSGDKIILSGDLGVKNKEVVVFKNISKPDLWSGEHLKQFLLQRGIRVEGDIKVGKTPEGARVLAESESAAIEKSISDMNKFSNNYVAEMLTKNLALQMNGNIQPANLHSGVQWIEKFLLKIGLSEKEFRFYNPSGLTRDNQFSARSIWQILDHSEKQFKTFPEFLASLPIAGVDGTLKNRMKNTKAQGWVRGKTGYLNGVVSLAGFLGQTDGSLVSFVFIYNGRADEAKVRSFFDQVLVSVLK